MHDVPNLDPDDPCIFIDHSELNSSSQQEFGSIDHRDELNMAEEDSDPIYVESNITVGLTTNIELKPILNESVEEPM
ncbi:hypothetical protein PVK06_020513 [Gossypium arboreum]|uniref:Uncharacterized protein n=1 Tax=Gossypium arboreum TaxID=29729 RepID=A0ABR0PN16_GOSAR|nr:hypothetical protein PVK06_020513 [Gossypium arboreum]